MWLVPLLTPAFAIPAGPDGDAACELASLSSTQPAADAVDVPTDVLPLLVFRGSCGLDVPYRVRVTADGESVPLHDVEVDFDAFQPVGEGFLLELALPELQPSTRYEVVAASTFGEPHAFAFTTGAGPLGDIAGIPQAELTAASTSGDRDFGWSVEADLSFTPVGPGGSVFVVRSDAAERAVVLQSGTGPFDARTSWFAYDDPSSELCVTVVERTANGVWLGPSDASCVESDTERTGCATLPTPGGVLLLGVTALALRRRRR